MHSSSLPRLLLNLDIIIKQHKSQGDTGSLKHGTESRGSAHFEKLLLLIKGDADDNACTKLEWTVIVLIDNMF
jgi:hypothetical protein